MFIQNILAVQLKMTAKEHKQLFYKAKFGVNQYDIV